MYSFTNIMNNIMSFESLTLNLSFLCLLLSLIFYWIQTFFYGKKENSNDISLDLQSKNFAQLLIKNGGQLSMVIANLSLFTLLALRWKESGHFPLSNLYESLIFLSWTFTTIHLILENSTPIPFLGSITSPSALLTNAFATFSLPVDMQQSSPLVPALQSNWLMMHVTVMILSYAALICGSLISIAFLILSKDFPNSLYQYENSNSLNSKFATLGNTDSKNFNPEAVETIGNFESATLVGNFSPSTYEKEPNPSVQKWGEFSSNMKSSKKFKLAQTLDHLSYRILGFGFPFLTIGILSGAVWANEAWGSYWSWDPKETWALLTWLVFAIYLHTRFSKGWSGKKPAIIASFGFVVVWVCYLGVNLMGEGLHSYGWIHS